MPQMFPVLWPKPTNQTQTSGQETPHSPRPSPQGENDPLTFTLPSKLSQFKGNKDRQGSQCPGDTAFFGYSHPLSQSGNNLICTSAAKLNVTVHVIQPRLPSLSKLVAFGFVAADVVEHSAAPQNTGNILMETIDAGENVVAGNKQLQPQRAGATPKDSGFQFILKY